MAGNGESRPTTCGPAPGNANWMMFVPVTAFASSNPCRSVPGPESAVLVAIIVSGTTRMVNEQAALLPDESCAVQVITLSPTGSEAPDGGVQVMVGFASK